MNDGELFGCGWNNKGQLGLSHCMNISQLQKVEKAPDKIIKIACGWDFTLALTAEKQLFVWGSNAYGQLGLSSQQSLPVPTLSPLADEVTDIAAGLRHSLLLTASGDIYSMGSGRKGQLGLGKNENKITSPQKVVISDSNSTHVKFTQLAAGSYHSLVLTDNGVLYGWGCNKFGQLGCDTRELISISKPLQIPVSFTVKSIHCGWTHNIITTESGAVYSWGRANYNQLGRQVSTGHCDWNIKQIPDLISYNICCGAEHNLAVTNGGKLLSWGWNEHGICGNGNEENISKPEPVKTFIDKNVLMIECSGGHSFALSGCG
ncbi:secretion-regulating guanine nucleotide exchange factor-like [Tubulanus polymorphus]|uniref:secretion-regulating guanine nucleotide exchange factor-like n=1 Tax=Tubulanus polymorphus TaxID=672921 RepID=UPI003DA4FBE3